MAIKASGSSLGRLSMPAKFVFGLILVGVVAAMYFVVFYTDVDGQISQAVAAETTLKGDLAKAEEAKVAYQKDVDKRAQKQELEVEQRRILPDTSEELSFLSSIQGVATISGVTLGRYKPEDEVSEEYYVRVPMSIELTGKFHQIARFFYGVGQLDRVINIEDIQMVVTQSKSNEADTSEVVLSVSCLATAFRKKGDGEAAPKGKKG